MGDYRIQVDKMAERETVGYSPKPPASSTTQYSDATHKLIAKLSVSKKY